MFYAIDEKGNIIAQLRKRMNEFKRPLIATENPIMITWRFVREDKSDKQFLIYRPIG